MLYKARKEVIKCFDDTSDNISCKTLKILTPKQML